MDRSAEQDDDFVPHQCVECDNDVPGSPDDVAVICGRCAHATLPTTTHDRETN